MFMYDQPANNHHAEDDDDGEKKIIRRPRTGSKGDIRREGALKRGASVSQVKIGQSR